jgi:hypothetical protein
LSALKEYRKQIAAGAVLAVFGIAILAVVTGYYFPSAATTQANTCSIMTMPPSAKLAPVTGWEYLLIYNTTDGSINSINVRSACEWDSSLAQRDLSSTNVTAISSLVLGLQPGYSYLDVASNSYLPMITTNGYSNAFYVNLQSDQLVLKQGVTFSGNYEQAYQNGQPITNGTSLPTPYQ